MQISGSWPCPTCRGTAGATAQGGDVMLFAALEESARTHFGWWCATSTDTGNDRQTLPRLLMDEMDDDPRRNDKAIGIRHTKREPAGGLAMFDTPELARDALARAVGRVARRLAGLPEVTP